MQSGRYTRILPAAPLPTPGGQPSTSGGPGGMGRDPRRRPGSQARPGACFGCRSRKTKCDGARPACANCLKRGQRTCDYPERLVNGQRATEFVRLLKAVSDERAVALVRRLREKGDLHTAMAEFKADTDAGDADADGQPDSPPRVEESWETKQLPWSLESELMANNPNGFPFLPYIDPAALARSHLLRPKPPAASSSDYSDLTFPEVSPHFPSEPFESLQQPVEYCDERLQFLQVDFWTDIKVSNEFAARVISLYIRTDHPLLGLFDTPLFIHDLVTRQTNYCSRFLFQAVMCLGCQMYSAFDENAMQHATGFLQSAEQLWMTQQSSCLSMAGAVLLSISLMGNGKDHAVLRYATDALEMGRQLGLFHDNTGPSGNVYESGADISGDELRARSYAAWGVFNWNVIISTFYRQPGSESPTSMPGVPIPNAMMYDGTCHRDNHNSGNVTAETERGEEDSLPEGAVLRTVFSALCNLWRLVYEARWIYYAVEESPPVYLRVTLVEYAYRELIAWVETLTPFLLRREQNPHYVVVFHIWLHTAILDMWQPFVYGKAAAAQEPPPAQAWTAPRTTQLKTFTAQDRTPEAAYTASVSQLKQLVVEYRSRHAASTYSILWHNGLIYLVNAMLRCTDAEWRLYLLLCVYGYERLSRPYRISEVITRGLLTMTMRDTDMSGSEAERIMTQIRDRGLDHLRDDLHHDIRATFMVDLSLALTDPEAAKAERMASGFGDMAAFQDMIDFDVMDAEGPLP